MQDGTIIERRGSWVLFYYDKQIRNGELTWVKVSKKLARKSHEYPTKQSVKQLARDILTPINKKQVLPESSLPMCEFIEKRYFPAKESELRPSTFHNYKKSIYEPHLKDRLKQFRLRDFRTSDGQRLMRSIPDLNHTTLLHIKNFLSGVFKFAMQQGILDNAVNPMMNVSVPGKPKKFEGAAYTIEDAETMISQIEDAAGKTWPVYRWEAASKTWTETEETVTVSDADAQNASDAILFLSLTGLRQSEARAVRWSDWNETDQTLFVQRSVWTTKIGPTKNSASNDYIPVLSLVRESLTRRRERIKANASDYIFAGAKRGTPLDFHNLVNRVIKPCLERGKVNGEGVDWHGWHGFRRGLASNLLALDVNPSIISKILRHESPMVTLAFYAKSRQAESKTAMQKLEKHILDRPSGITVAGRALR